jgi:hypothetical protein
MEYERNLVEVGEKVDLLTEIIAHKNQKHGLLRHERDKVGSLNLRLKEDSNRLHFQHIQIEEKVAQLIELVDPERLSTLEIDLPQKV